MSRDPFDRAVDAILKRDSRYPREAYTLMPVVLEHTLRKRREAGEESSDGHLTGQQFCKGFEDYMDSLYGPFALGLLHEMNLRSTEDVGNLVYNLIEEGVFGKTARDSRQDFREVFDFDEAFRLPFLPDLPPETLAQMEAQLEARLGSPRP